MLCTSRQRKPQHRSGGCHKRGGGLQYTGWHVRRTSLKGMGAQPSLASSRASANHLNFQGGDWFPAWLVEAGVSAHPSGQDYS